MTNVTQRIQAFVILREGMRFRYDCPPMSMEDHESDQFFRKYSGRNCTIVGFPTHFVPPLNTDGLWLGEYYKHDYAIVRFDGEEKTHTLHVKFFVLLSEAVTSTLDDVQSSRLAGDLPHSIDFYPGDTVYKSDDLLRTERVVQRIHLKDDGTPVYVLCESEDDRRKREADDESARLAAKEDRKAMNDPADRAFSILSFRPSSPKTETCHGDQLKLLTMGNVHHLYTGTEPKFTSMSELLLFWSRQGLSKTVYIGNGMSTRWEYSLDDARKLFESGEGDLVLRSKEDTEVIVTGRTGDHKVRRVQDCFEQYRGSVRAATKKLLGQMIGKLPTEPDRDVREMFANL